MRRVYVFLSMLFVLGFIIACVPTAPGASPASEVVPTATSLSRLQPSPSSISTPTSSVTPAAVKTQESTPTPVATQAAADIPTIPASTVAALQTMDAIVTGNPKAGEYYRWDCIIYPCYTTGLGLSPNGLWAVFFASRDNNGGLVISATDSENYWEIYNSDITGDDTGGVAYLTVEHWSLDGKYVYLTPECECSYGYSWIWHSNPGLIRFDLGTGKWTNTKMGAAFSFSPNDHYLAYWGEQGVRIHELITGIEQVITPPEEFLACGQIVWSPDSTKLIFVCSAEDLDAVEEHTQGFTAYVLDLDEKALQLIYQNDIRYIYPVSWDEANIITLKSHINGPGNYTLNIETREIIAK